MASGEDVEEDAHEGATSFQEPPNGARLASDSRRHPSF